jgi:hypothetical protein
MGPIVERRLEHLLVSDNAIVKIRRLLLQTLRDHAAGRPLPGINPQSFRVRSFRFEAPPDASFSQLVDQRLGVDA